MTRNTDIFNDAPAIADIDADGTAEIFIITSGRYDYTAGATLTTSPTWETVSNVVGHEGNADRWIPNLADFDEDGTPEIYNDRVSYQVSLQKKILREKP